MKGLILKDLYTIRTQIIVGAIICLYPAVLLHLGLTNMLSDISMSDSVASDLEKLMLSFVTLLISYCFIVPFSSFLLNTMKSDYECGWLKIQRTMPLNAGEAIGSKLICTGIVIGIFTLLALIVNIIILIREPEFIIAEIAIAGPVCIGLLQVIAVAPCFPLGMKIGVKKTDGLYLTFVILTGLILIIFGFAAFSNDISTTAVRIICYAVLPVATALTVFISYKAGKNQITKDL